MVGASTHEKTFEVELGTWKWHTHLVAISSPAILVAIFARPDSTIITNPLHTSSERRPTVTSSWYEL